MALLFRRHSRAGRRPGAPCLQLAELRLMPAPIPELAPTSELLRSAGLAVRELQDTFFQA